MIGDKDIGFSQIPESLQEIQHIGRNNILYRLQVGSVQVLIKELRLDSIYWELGKDANEVCDQMRTVYAIVKKYYGNDLQDTTYVVKKNKKGYETVITIQEEIAGKTLLQEVQEGDGDDSIRCNLVREAFDKKWDEVMADIGWEQLPTITEMFFKRNGSYKDIDIELGQIIHTPEDRYVLIDF